MTRTALFPLVSSQMCLKPQIQPQNTHQLFLILSRILHAGDGSQHLAPARQALNGSNTARPVPSPTGEGTARTQLVLAPSASDTHDVRMELHLQTSSTEAGPGLPPSPGQIPGRELPGDVATKRLWSVCRAVGEVLLETPAGAGLAATPPSDEFDLETDRSLVAQGSACSRL